MPELDLLRVQTRRLRSETGACKVAEPGRGAQNILSERLCPLGIDTEWLSGVLPTWSS